MPTTVSSTQVRLQVIGGRSEGKTIPVTGPAFVIGREPGCQLRTNNPEISRRHAEITIDEDEVTLRDLGSRNGTFRRGMPVSRPTRLEDGDKIAVGPLRFLVSIETPAESEVAEEDAPSDRREPSASRASAAVSDDETVFEEVSEEETIFGDDSGDEKVSGETETASVDDVNSLIAEFLANRKV